MFRLLTSRPGLGGGAPLTYEPSLNCSSTCTATGLDLESVIPEYKLIQKKKKKKCKIRSANHGKPREIAEGDMLLDMLEIKLV